MPRDFAKTPASKRKKPAASRGKSDPGGSGRLSSRKPAARKTSTRTASNRTTSNRRKNSQTNGFSKKILLIGCILILLGSFGAVLMWLGENTDTAPAQANNNTSSKQTASAKKSPVKTSPAKKEPAKPAADKKEPPAKTIKAEPKEPEFEFYTELPKMEVEVPQPKVAPRASYEYTLQIASFKQRNDADAMIAKLALLGKEAWISESSNKGNLWYRVRLGPWQSKRQVDKIRHQLQRKKINNTIVLRAKKDG
ncbi:SPOR domain-containing protein [Pelagibaculum spongiae]|uniref:SPOR domain-containing protein n=1 Tax=Pelagibaculum spongiae TaxID=2080658 RepID=A0A2V1GSJ2_9GAMM|nr:SPOR domain-containing protein [Pelagibaculum spongiae]PVZ68262.1 hypothetical protein DC094_13295 [Pelagibaculum spongiae]